MYKKIRKKVAGSVSKLDLPEHYDWNRWLRVPESDEYYVESISSTILDTSGEPLWPRIPSTRGFTYDFPKVKISKAFKQLNIQKQKSNKIFFSFPKTTLSEIKEILSEAEIDFSLSVADSRKGAIFRLIEGKKKKTPEASAEVLIREFYLMAPGVFNFPMLVPGGKVYSVKVGLTDKVKVLDLLSNLKTEIINVELLTSANFNNQLKSAESKEVKFQPLPKISSVTKVEVMKLEKLLQSINEQKKHVLIVDFAPLSSSVEQTEFKIPYSVKNKLKILSVKNFSITAPKVKQGLKISDKILSDSERSTVSDRKKKTRAESRNLISKDLEVVLQPAINFTDEEKARIYEFLFDYQKVAADFLCERETALLNDQTGTGKSLETIAALKILFTRKNITNAMIVCRDEDTGWPKRDPALSTKSLSGWYDHIQKYLPGITAGIIYDNLEPEWKNTLDIRILNYRVFQDALDKKLLSLKELDKSCLIIDEVEDFPEIAITPLPKYLWMLSGLPSEELKSKISAITDSEDPVINLGRSKKEIADTLPSRVRQDYWIQMDPDQKLEYEKALESGRERIYELVQAGNPFLVQSNVFTLVHQLTQIGNFPGKKESSTKAELLLHHIKSIQGCGKKALVYSQYDRQGTQRLEKLFEKNGIKYVLYQTGISLKEMEDAVKNFTRNKSVTVFLAGLKAINAKMNLANVSYLIHFDQWWSPATTWQAEDRIASVTDNPAQDKLTIYNYFIKNSIDEKIQMKLNEKGLDNKSLFDLLSSEGMYFLMTNEDWLEVLELIEPKDPELVKKAKKEQLDYLLSLTTEDFAYKVRALIGRVGYKNISIRTAANPGEVRLFATAPRNPGETKAVVQCLNMKVVPKKVVKDCVDSLIAGIEKVFVFTTGEFDEKLIANPGDERVTLIDKHQIANYLDLFSLV